MNVFFDLDGTLIDSRADLAVSVNLTRAAYGLEPLPLKCVVAAVGEGMTNLLIRTCPELTEKLEEALPVMRTHYAANLTGATTLYPGIGEVIHALRAKGCALAVVSNKPAAFIAPILSRFGVLEAFSAIVGGGDTPRLKPDPAPLHLAARRMATEITPADWVIGDHHTDLEMARTLGLNSCYCAYGFGDPRGETATARAETPAEILTCITRKEAS